jgi:hypothetical protein
MAQATAILVKTTGDIESVIIPEENGHTVIHESVGGWFDVVSCDDFVVYVHDEGLLIPLEPNLAISALLGRVIAGDVLIVGSLNEKGNYDGENYDAPARFFTSDFAEAVSAWVGDEKVTQAWNEAREAILDRGPIVTSW